MKKEEVSNLTTIVWTREEKINIRRVAWEKQNRKRIK